MSNLIENTLVKHRNFVACLERLKQVYDCSFDSSEPTCIMVLEESGGGKSRLLEELSVIYQPNRDDDSLKTPILFVKPGETPTPKGLAFEMLSALGDPIADKGTSPIARKRLVKLLAKCGTRVIAIDEFQHFVDTNSHKVINDVANWLKLLVDDAEVALIVAGLPSAKEVIQQNGQLGRRFDAPIRLPRFDWRVESDKREFKAILMAFNKEISKQYQISTIESDENAFKFYAASGGLIGFLTKLLRQAVWNANTTKSKKIDQNHFRKAFEQTMWQEVFGLKRINPFTTHFKVEEQLNNISAFMKIGAQKTIDPSSLAAPPKKGCTQLRDVF